MTVPVSRIPGSLLGANPSSSAVVLEGVAFDIHSAKAGYPFGVVPKYEGVIGCCDANVAPSGSVL